MTPAQKAGFADGTTFGEENPREDLERTLAPGQLGADEALINALGVEETAKLFGTRTASDFAIACDEYNRAFEIAVARALKAKTT